jgi:CDP-diacylglycerol--glycerol-3-phosphate 3-phosphatidyltransferase
MRQANGFHGSRGISGLIPEGYTYLEQLFMKAVQAAKRCWTATSDKKEGNGIQLNEWAREGWTYHAKGKLARFPQNRPNTGFSFFPYQGIWLSPSTNADPLLTLFGSTNLNSRSSNLDTELSFIMVTSSPVLRRKLREEVLGLREFSTPWKGESRKVRWRTMFLVAIVGGML